MTNKEIVDTINALQSQAFTLTSKLIKLKQEFMTVCPDCRGSKENYKRVPIGDSFPRCSTCLGNGKVVKDDV